MLLSTSLTKNMEVECIGYVLRPRTCGHCEPKETEIKHNMMSSLFSLTMFHSYELLQVTDIQFNFSDLKKLIRVKRSQGE